MPAHRRDSITVDFRIDRETYERFKACLATGINPSEALRTLILATIERAPKRAAMPEDLP